MIRFTLALMVCMAATGPAQSQDSSRNFYVKPTKTEKPKADELKADESKASAKPATAVTPKSQPKKSAATIDLTIRPKATTGGFDPPLDPYGLADIFHERWDFTSFLMSEKEELRFRLNAARQRTLRLARAFSALSEEVETRQRNLNSAALAAYLLSRDQHSWSPVEGRNLTEAQMLAVRATMTQDIAAMRSALENYEILRNSLNASAQEVALMEEKGLAPKADNRPDTGITISTADLARHQTESVLKERQLPLEALKAALAAEALRNTTERRQSIASFAPPPPMGRRITPGTSSAPPQLPGDDILKNQPKGESLKQPERLALVFETPVNAPVFAARDGVAVFAGAFRGYGDMVIVEHAKGEFSIYSHLANIQVMERQPVKAGTILGRAGTLPEVGHAGLHFQVRKNNKAIAPEQWLGTNQVDRLLTKK